MFDEIEYVDPKDSECGECGCSFGIHLMSCSHFVSPSLSKKLCSCGREMEDCIAFDNGDDFQHGR